MQPGGDLLPSVLDWLMEHRTADSIEEVTEEILVMVSQRSYVVFIVSIMVMVRIIFFIMVMFMVLVMVMVIVMVLNINCIVSVGIIS